MATTRHDIGISVSDARTRRREGQRAVGLKRAVVISFMLAGVIAAGLFVGLRPTTEAPTAARTGAQRVFVIGSNDPARLNALDHAYGRRAAKGSGGVDEQRIFLIGSNMPARLDALAHAR